MFYEHMHFKALKSKTAMNVDVNTFKLQNKNIEHIIII